MMSSFNTCYRELLGRVTGPFVVRRINRYIAKWKKDNELALNARIEQLCLCRGLRYYKPAEDPKRNAPIIILSYNDDAGPFYSLNYPEIEELLNSFREDRQFFALYNEYKNYQIKIHGSAMWRLEQEGFLDKTAEKISFDRVIRTYDNLIGQFEYARLTMRRLSQPRVVTFNENVAQRTEGTSRPKPAYLKSVP